MSARAERLQRRTEQRSGQTNGRRKRCKIDDEEDDVIVIEQEPEKPDGSKIWCCQLCPIFMSSANEMQVLVPCGHTLCFDCSTHLKYCPIEECSRKVNKILMPKIQQTDEENVDSQQPETISREQIELGRHLDKVEVNLNKARQKRKQSEELLFAEHDKRRKEFEDINDSKTALDFKLNKTKQKIPIAKYFDTIENAPVTFLDPNYRPCPTQKVQNGICEYEFGKSGYKRAAVLLSDELNQEESSFEFKLTSEQLNCKKDLDENEILESSICELINDLKSSKEKPGLLKYFEDISGKAPSRLISPSFSFRFNSTV